MELLTETYNMFKNIYKKPALKIVPFPLTDSDKALIKQYALEPSNFDGDNFRQDAYSRGPLNGIRIGDHTLYTIGQINDFNSHQISQFARVLQTMGKKIYTIYWFLSPNKRIFPPKNESPTAINVNGGYCQACKPNTIVIYRIEDAVRVLIHELMHAACCDDHSKSIPSIEAETEAWAELFYSMLMANEYGLSPQESWAIQSGWSAGQNERLRSLHNVNRPSDYAWRYTVGKEMVWRRWGLFVPQPPPKHSGNSLALGAPDTLWIKDHRKN